MYSALKVSVCNTQPWNHIKCKLIPSFLMGLHINIGVHKDPINILESIIIIKHPLLVASLTWKNNVQVGQISVKVLYFGNYLQRRGKKLNYKNGQAKMLKIIFKFLTGQREGGTAFLNLKYYTFYRRDKIDPFLLKTFLHIYKNKIAGCVQFIFYKRTSVTPIDVGASSFQTTNPIQFVAIFIQYVTTRGIVQHYLLQKLLNFLKTTLVSHFISKNRDDSTRLRVAILVPAGNARLVEVSFPISEIIMVIRLNGQRIDVNLIQVSHGRQFRRRTPRILD